MGEQQRPLCVDLDGSLLKTDMFWESLLLLLKQKPLTMPLVPVWLLKGRAHLKRQIALRVELSAEHLPYNIPVVDFVAAAKRANRPVLLVTATDQLLADRIASHLGFFDEVLATTPGSNLKGRAKAEALVGRFGEKGFDYLGDSAADLSVWSHAHLAYVVGDSPSFMRLAGRAAPVAKVFPGKAFSLRAVAKALRPHQWVKNILIFLPLIAAHRFTEVALLLKAAAAFVSFSLCASSVYVLNDIVDIESDRKHRTKRSRPFASGSLSLALGVPLSLGLLALAALVAAFVNRDYAIVLAAYYAITCFYSFVGKRLVIGDVVLLATLYTIRVFAGGAATGVPVSDWLMAFSLFLFSSLAFMKRFTELQAVSDAGLEKAGGRGYVASDLGVIGQLGSASGYLSILIFSLYVSRPDVTALYSNPSRLWLASPVLIYWISRIWVIAYRKQMHDDPVVFALKDPMSYVVGVLIFAVMLLAL